MSALPKEILEEARLLRETGHSKQCLRLLDEATRCAPEDFEAIVGEREKALASDRVPLRRCRAVITRVVDNLGPPVVFLVMAVVALLLAPILFVPAW